MCFLLGACMPSSASPPAVFVTDYGLGPDKWATAWLLTHKVDPAARLVVVGMGKPLTEGTSFDVVDSPLRRQRDMAAFEVVRTSKGIQDPEVTRLAQIVHDIEVNFWGTGVDPSSPLVERQYRSLQRTYGREAVTPECYVAFFDSVYDALRRERTQGVEVSADSLLSDCNAIASVATKAMVPEVPIATLLAEMRRGKSVVFIDVREADEFNEGHIPGALNVPLRDLDDEIVDRVRDADYVVSYCVKDFRGFEMAKSLHALGVKNSVILSPYGIRGWVAEGLPTAGAKALSETEAGMRLTACMAMPGQCAPPQGEKG